MFEYMLALANLQTNKIKKTCTKMQQFSAKKLMF